MSFITINFSETDNLKGELSLDNFVLRDQDLFLVADPLGEIDEKGKETGLYSKDTRFLSGNLLTINGERIKLLSKKVKSNFSVSFLYVYELSEQGAIEILKEPLIREGYYYERLTFTNYFSKPINIDIAIQFAADFQDIFIVRGFRSGLTGQKKKTVQTNHSLLYTYEGHDKLLRHTLIEWDKTVKAVSEKETAHFNFHMDIGKSETLTVKVHPYFETKTKTETKTKDKIKLFDEEMQELSKKYKDWTTSFPKLKTDDSVFMKMYHQAVDDMQMLLADIGHGEIIVAGIPWYAVPFGRDSIITALFLLAVKPDLAKGTIKTLAAYQGKEYNSIRDEEPGKIMHEIRFGELTTTGQTPFNPYYGSVDATVLFLLLVSEYYRWTNDTKFIQQIKPHLDSALEWIRQKEAEGNNPFVQYKKEAEEGIPNQGWKDSSNSIIHKDGRFAESPIALIEVQAYVCAAKSRFAEIYEALGYEEESEKLIDESTKLLSQIEDFFWIEEENYYALALDGYNEKVLTVTSNPGHLLFTDVLQKDAIIDRLTSEELNSGYGIRTMSKNEVGYYPMSYHNGSVWPHDNGMIMLGLLHKNCLDDDLLINSMEQIVEASLHFENQRLPELYCGYDRGDDELIPYLTSCSPQAWSAATAILYAQLMTGLMPNAIDKTIKIQPRLLSSMNFLKMSEIHINNGKLSLYIYRLKGGTVKYEVLKNSTGYKVI